MKNKVLTILLLLNLCFIWTQSLLPGELSSGESGTLFRLLEPLLTVLWGGGNVSEWMLRKTAHFTEFGVLGCLAVCRGLAAGRHISRQFLLRCIFFCWFVAFIDETLQIFSGRGSCIPDVWLDLSGAVCGILVSFFAVYIRQKVKDRKGC